MNSIRVVIVDDSAFVRKVIKEMLSTSPGIKVAGMARNGTDALQMVESLNPDVVTCDLVMPECDGVSFVRQQMRRKALPILIFSSSLQDAGLVMEALAAGAIDFIQKPTALASEKLFLIQSELIEKIKAAAHAPGRLLSPPPVFETARPAPSPSPKKVDLVVLGTSTGGPQALRYLVPRFAADFPVPLVIVLHMPVGYTAPFAEKLAELSPLKVREASQDCPVLRGEVLLAPAGRHLSFKRLPDGTVAVRLSMNPLDKPHRPSVDVLFQSAAEVYGSRVMGVVLTGMGNDGQEGAAAIKAQGGMILTESEESCIIYGMPRSVAESGLSDKSVSLASMAEEICRRL